MTIRIAVAAERDSDRVAHFGAAERFVVFQLEDASTSFVENRMVRSFCGESRDRDAAASETIMAIAECSSVLASAVGPCGLRALERAGLDTFQANGSLLDAVESYRSQRGYRGAGSND